MLENYLVALVFLIILSFLDIKTFQLREGFIPSVLTTSFMIIAFIMAGESGLVTGLFAGLIALLFVDLNMFQGVPDVKVFIALGLTLPSIALVGFLSLFTVGSIIIYQSILVFTKLTIKKTAGIPFLLIAYIGVLGMILI